MAALAAACAFVVLILLGGGDGEGRTYRLLFENGGQLVPGNEVLVAGQPIGSVEDMDLTDDGQAEVEISVEHPLHDGTSAVIRATSLSGIANRYVSIAPGPDNAPELPDGATLGGDDTTAPVDLDQLFNTFPARTREALRQIAEGSATLYAGNTADARRTYRFLAPSLSTTQRLFAEINRDERVFSEFLVNGARTLGAVAERRDDLSALTENANTALGAIAQENEAFDRALEGLPSALRQGGETFVTVRETLDRLDPLVAEAKPATRDLAPFLRQARPVLEEAVPVVDDLGSAVHRDGGANDLTDALRDLPRAQDRAADAIPEAIQAMDDSQPVVEFARPYSPDVFAWITKFGQVSAYYDANGHYARIQSANANIFDYLPATSLLDPIPLVDQFDDLEFGIYTRCPGGATQPIAGSNPFLDDGALAGDCDPSDVPPGP